ncbi:tetratricopeptide repeat protein [Streptomyces sp. NPDC006172]|uniref:tetratricopeptide repeat protein n=1 Tax=Streptomyces sp. NPDC006172 TaxID=3154470 RepID=UPI003403C1E1
MSRLSREKKRDQEHAGRPAGAVAPLDVHVPGGGPATIGGVPVVPGDGEEPQQAVLRHLHRIALAGGRPVAATVHDERIGYVVPLRVEPNGSSHFTGQPLRVAPPAGESPTATPPVTAPVPAQSRAPRSVPEQRDAVRSPAPGTATAPTGVFGPPPEMEAERPAPAPRAEDAPEVVARPRELPEEHAPAEPSDRVSAPAPAADVSAFRLTPEPARPRPLIPESGFEAGPDPEPKPAPARGFDAVAEAVLGEDPRTLPGAGGAPALLGEPMAQINEAVRAGRTQAAAALAERTVTEASATLGSEHPEVLRLRELTAYIAYLAGDPLRSFHVSLDLARIHRRGRDAEAAYGNVQSAATAWRAVRDPFQGLHLGSELLTLWSELTSEEGPAADDAEELESARARMLRLAERARKAGAAQPG